MVVAALSAGGVVAESLAEVFPLQPFRLLQVLRPMQQMRLGVVVAVPHRPTSLTTQFVKALWFLKCGWASRRCRSESRLRLRPLDVPPGEGCRRHLFVVMPRWVNQVSVVEAQW